MNDRIKLIRKTSGLNQTEFGNKIGATRDTIANIEGGRIEIRDIYIKSICREFSINEEWLISGTGEMYLPQDDTTASILSDVLEDPSPEFYQLCLGLLETYQKLDANGKKIINDQARAMAERILKSQD